MKSWYTIRARAAGAEVLIYDEIGAYGVTAKGFLAELGALPDDAAIDLRLNSPGGSVFDAVAIYNALKRHAGDITVWIDGIAASAASYIAMAGDTIVMPENAFLMIHDPSGLVMGTATDMRDMAETLDKIAASMTRGYAAKSGKSEEDIAALMAAEAKLGNSTDFLRTARDIVYSQHEHWDGSGYPRGLAGEDIPLAARVIAGGAVVVKHNGEQLTGTNIGMALATRDLMQDLRAADPFRQGGGRPFSKADRSRFLDVLEREVRASKA